MVAESECNCSLSDVIKTWLERVCAPKELTDLVQQALEDSRLLLFVDGLDEWSSETAARSTLALLEQFVGERQVPVLASSRPLGFERLGGLSGKWRRAKLPGLNADQQREFAFRWFLHRASTSRPPGGQDADMEAEGFAAREARELTEDIQRDGRISRLAETPLLLSGLIALSVQRVRLPRNRFKAYDQLSHLLLEEQPQRREKAAHARSSASGISQETRERALARLAYRIHQAPGSDTLDKSVAHDELVEFFTSYRCKSPAEALELAEEMLTIGTETVGILVEKSPQDVGFLHRAFQEFLAARYLSGLPFDEQRTIFAAWFGNPQWHDVLLCLCQLASRTDEVDALVELARSVSLPPESEADRLAFFAEIAFGDLHCSAPVALDLATRTFDQIETSAWMVLRERLLDHALDGLFSDVLRAETETRIERWYPGRHSSRIGLFQAMGQWPHEEGTVEALWRGLLDEDESARRAAAEAVARNFGGDPGIGERLLRRVLSPADPEVTAHVLHALCLGWPNAPGLPQLLLEARQSASLGLRIAAVSHRVRRQEQDKQDRAVLLDFGSGRLLGAWQWRTDAIDAIVAGWPGDPNIKQAAIRGLSAQWPLEGPLSWDFAGPILTRGFPQDDETAEVIAELFRSEQYPQHRLGVSRSSELLLQSFKGHALLRDAIDQWLGRQKTIVLDYGLCLVSGTPEAKRILLSARDEKGVLKGEPARWLFEGWGMGDQEVAHVLSALADSPDAPRIAELLPFITTDREQCRQRLLSWLLEANENLAWASLLGLIKLGCDERDAEVADVAANRFAGRIATGAIWGSVSNVIEHFANHPEVRKLSWLQIGNRGGSVAAVAQAYRDDAGMRREIVQRTTPLPASLRLRIIDRLARLAVDHEFGFRLLSEYDQDTNAEVKTAAAVAYARSARTVIRDQDTVVEKFSEGVAAVGLDMDERRQAAFAGLLEMDRLDIVAKAHEAEAGRLPLIQLGGPFATNPTLASHLARNWERLRKVFGDTFLEQSGYLPDEFLEDIGSQVNDPTLLEQIIGKMERNKGQPLPVAALRIRSRQWRGTEQLRCLCVDLVSEFYPRDWNLAAPGILAAEILSEQFGSDSATKQELEGRAAKAGNPSPLIMALCASWPESPAIERLPVQDKYGPLLTPAKCYLLARRQAPAECFARLQSAISLLTGDIWDFLPSCVRAFGFRFERDADLRELAFKRLEGGNASPPEKANFPQFLRRSDRQVDRLLDWCRAELGRQNSGEHLPESALDLFSGQVRPIAHLLLNLLNG
jgi:hypothetical protein